MKKLVKILLKSIYYLFPQFLRHQYVESIIFYRSCFAKILSQEKKIENERFKIFNVKLVTEPDLLDINFELLAHTTERCAKVSAPILYVDNQECKRSALEGKLPDTKVVRLNEVYVLGSTDAIIVDNKMYHHELSLMSSIHDLKRPDIFSKNNDNDSDYWVSSCSKKNTVEGVAISLLKEHSINYYHWMTEVMPKLVEIIQVLKEKEYNISILVEENMPTQSVGIIDLLLADIKTIEYSIITVKKGELVFCEHLIYCTPLWVSLDNTRYLPNPKKEFFVSVESLEKVKEKITQAKKINNVVLKNRKIYLQRENSKLRKITNILEVERLLYKYGFDFVDPGSLDFEEQYNLFSQADIIIGASGAAFTNLLFMKDNSKAISLYPSAQSTNYYVFQPLADVSNVELIHFLTTPNDRSNSVHGDSLINIQDLDKLLDEKMKR